MGLGPGQVEDALRALGPGQPLPASERAFFESRFGHDFGRVRVHDGPRAAGVARALNARAFTRSRDVVFDAGEYAPGTWSGRHLLAHESDARGCSKSGGRPGRRTPGRQGLGLEGGTIQRDLATPEPAVAPGAQPDLTDEQIRQAIAFNRQRFGFNPASTRLIQDLVGTEPTGVWAEDDIRAIAAGAGAVRAEEGRHGGGRHLPFPRPGGARGALEPQRRQLPDLLPRPLRAPRGGPVVAGRRSLTVSLSMHARFPTHSRLPGLSVPAVHPGPTAARAGRSGHRPGAYLQHPARRGRPAHRLHRGRQHHPPRPSTMATATSRQRGSTTTSTTPERRTRRTAAATWGRTAGTEPDGVVTGDVFDIQLDFRGEIQRRGRVATSLQWTPIRGRFPVP